MGYGLMIVEDKNVIRKRMIEGRNGMNLRQIAEKSAAITEKLCSLRQYSDAQTLTVYMSYRNEVSTEAFIERCLCQGKRVAIPKVVTVPALTLELYEIRDLRNDVLPGFKGIPEPNSAVLKKVDPQDIDFAVIPGLSFDYGGHRIGYGAGLYDRLLAKLRPECLKVGIAYDMQMMEQLMAEKHDITMDMVITEKSCRQTYRNRK
jgi:5-formyltetrahydrofolate cyclo-ligase